MFENLLSFSKTNTFNSDTAELLGGESARASLETKTPLNEKVAEVVLRENLNPEQIQRVVEEANIAVDLYKKGESFDLAKTADVLIILKKNSGHESKESDDYATPPECHDTCSEVKFSDLFGIKADTSQGEAIEDGVPRGHKLHVKIVKLGAARDAINSYYQELLRKQEGQINEFVKSAEALYHEDKKALREVLGLIKIAHPKEAANLIPYMNEVFQRRELIEKTAAIVPYELISDDLKNHAIITNGENIMIKQVTTIKNTNDDVIECKFGIIKIDDEIAKLKEEIKTL